MHLLRKEKFITSSFNYSIAEMSVLTSFTCLGREKRFLAGSPSFTPGMTLGCSIVAGILFQKSVGSLQKSALTDFECTK